MESAVERGIHVAGHVPYGYVRGPDRRLAPDPDAAPVVLGIFERRARGWSWARLARWVGEQGREITENGVRDLVRNPAYLGQARYGDAVREDAHEAIVPRGLWRRCQTKRRPSARSGTLTGRFLLQGLCECAACGTTLYLSGGSRKTPYYYCRALRCGDRAYARAAELDAHVLAVLEERVDEASPGSWVARPGAEREVEDADAALDEARADLDGFLADTTLRRTLGAERYNAAAADYVAVVNKAEADLADARDRSGGRYELVARLWLQEWGWAERKEYVSRMIRSVVVSKGREPLSERVEVELR